MEEKRKGFWQIKKQKGDNNLQKRAPQLQEWLVILLNFFHLALFYLVCCGVFGIRHIAVVHLCALAVFPFLLYCIRCKSKGFSKFLWMHAAAFAGFGFLFWIGNASLTEKILFVIIMVFYECFSFYLQGSEGAEKESVLPPAVSVGLFAVAFFIQNMLEDTGLRPFLAGLTVVYLSLYLVHFYLENYLNFMKVNRVGAGRFQGRKLFRSGILMAGGYILFCAIILAVCTNQALGNWMGQKLTAFLRFLFSGFQGEGGGMEEAEAGPFAEPPVMMPDNLEAGKLGIFWGILDKLLGIVVTFLLLAALAALVLVVAKWIRSLLGKRHHVAVLEGDSRIQDITESLDRNSGKKERRRLFYGLTNNARIRKVYAGFIKHRKKHLEERLTKELSCSTVRECVQALSSEERSADRLIQIYEWARYSEKECDSTDLRSFKHTLNRLRE